MADRKMCAKPLLQFLFSRVAETVRYEIYTTENDQERELRKDGTMVS